MLCLAACSSTPQKVVITPSIEDTSKITGKNLPSYYKILYSTSCNKYIVRYGDIQGSFTYEMMLYREPTYKFISLIDTLALHEFAQYAAVNDSGEAIQMIKDHYQQILEDRANNARNALHSSPNIGSTPNPCNDYK